MKIYALLSWYDEDPAHLRRCVTSLGGFADVLVALDGAYATFPGARAESPAPQHWALSEAARVSPVRPFLVAGGGTWEGGEVEKRAALFDYGREAGATANDWFLIIDADMALVSFTPDARDQLEATDLDVTEVNWHDVQIDGKICSTHRFRSMFRALPGLTVERAHWLYTVPRACVPDHPQRPTGGLPCCEGCACTCGTSFSFACECHGNDQGDSRRFLWRAPDGNEPEPALDLTDAVTLHHYRSGRDPERANRALTYYRERDAAGLEALGDWR